MFWLINALKAGKIKSVGQAIRAFTNVNGRAPSGVEKLRIGQIFENTKAKVLPFRYKKSFKQEIDEMSKPAPTVGGKTIEEALGGISWADKKKKVKRIKQGLSTKIKLNTLGENKQLAKELVSGKNSEFNTLDKAAKREVLDRLEINIKNTKADFATPVKPEDLASGGRIGFGKGKIVREILSLLKNPKKLRAAVDDIFPTGDYKYDAQMAAEALVENNPKAFGGKLLDDLDDATQSDIYGAVLRVVQSDLAKTLQMKRLPKPTKTLEGIKKTGTIDISDPNVADEFTRFMKETDPKGFKDLEQKVELSNLDIKGKKGHASGGLAYMLGEPTYSDGGRIGFSSGSTELTDFLQRLKEAKNGTGRYSDMPASQREMLVKSLTGQINVMLGKGHAEGGRIGFKEGNGAIGSAGDYALWKKAIKEGKISSGTSFWYFLELLETGGLPGTNKAEGGRIGFKDGTKFDPTKRSFLKIAAGLAALPVVGKFFKWAKPAAKAVSKAAKVTKLPGGQPDYISDLIAVVKAKGTRESVPGYKSSDLGTKHTYKGVEVTEEAGGNVRIKKEVEGGGQYTDEFGETDTWDGVVRELDIEITKGGYVKNKQGKIVKEADEYFEGTVTPDMDGKMKDIVEEIDEIDHLDLKEIADEAKDLMIKKASGGRVPFIFGGSAGLKALWKRLMKAGGAERKTLFPRASEKATRLGKLVMPEEIANLEALTIKQLENMLDALKTDKKMITQVEKNKAMRDPGLDFLMGKLEETGQPFANIKKYTDIDNDILVVEQMIKNKVMKGRKPNASGGQAYMLGEKRT